MQVVFPVWGLWNFGKFLSVTALCIGYRMIGLEAAGAKRTVKQEYGEKKREREREREEEEKLG